MKRIIFIIFLIIFFSGCARYQDEVKSKINQTIFNKIKAAVLLKIDLSSEEEAYKVIFSKEDLNQFKNEMKNISNIKEYTSNPSLPGKFGNNLHDLMVFRRHADDPMVLLYSIEDQIMLLRKRDVFPNTKDKLPNITIYQFRITKISSNILKKYEKKLPVEGFFNGSWPMDSYFSK